MTIKDLKRILNDICEHLDEYEEEEEIEKKSNTHFLGSYTYFLGISGSNGGFINLDFPTGEEEEELY